MKSILNNLLVVEDNTFIGECIVNAAKKNTSIKNIHLTESLQEAISFFDDTNFDLVILDLKLPDGSGIELLKTLKEKKIETRVYVFSVSIELKSYCLKYGVCTFFDKTKDFDKLIEAITAA
ncbi:response regulator [Polaribacter sp. L3A8]|uniref:response regulator n=1 Tax=Polaribacter sp. L3A8 TaxID=2686361 RepID=UPI00131C74C1|nr:response regulator [Polaribacter sp. L3A8]